MFRASGLMPPSLGLRTFVLVITLPNSSQHMLQPCLLRMVQWLGRFSTVELWARGIGAIWVASDKEVWEGYLGQSSISTSEVRPVRWFTIPSQSCREDLWVKGQSFIGSGCVDHSPSGRPLLYSVVLHARSRLNQSIFTHTHTHTHPPTMLPILR